MIPSSMLEHLRALIETETGFRAYSMDASRKPFPRVVISPAYAVLGDRPLSDDLGQVEQDIRLTTAGASVAAMLDVAEAARRCLSPGLGWRHHRIDGWVLGTKFVRSEITEVDRDAELTVTGNHPVYTVETFHVSSERTS